MLKRPVVLVDAFDAKCSDYRNEQVELRNLILIAIVEIGGMPAHRVEEGLRASRSVGPEARAATIAALKGK